MKISIPKENILNEQIKMTNVPVGKWHKILIKCLKYFPTGMQNFIYSKVKMCFLTDEYIKKQTLIKEIESYNIKPTVIFNNTGFYNYYFDPRTQCYIFYDKD